MHFIRLLDVAKVAAARDCRQPGVGDHNCQPGQIRLRREHIAVAADRQHRAEDAAPQAEIVVRGCFGGSGEAGGPGIVAEVAETPPVEWLRDLRRTGTSTVP